MPGLPSRSKRQKSAFAQDGLRRDSLRRASLAKAGAAEGIRTPDPRITNAVLYRLSYRGNNRIFAYRGENFQPNAGVPGGTCIDKPSKVKFPR
jgi:hypothetical protein